MIKSNLVCNGSIANVYIKWDHPTLIPTHISTISMRLFLLFTCCCSCCANGSGSCGCHGDVGSCSLSSSEVDSLEEVPRSSEVVAAETVVGVAVPRLIGGLIPKRSSSQVSVQATSRILSNASCDKTEEGTVGVGWAGVGVATLLDAVVVSMETGTLSLQV